MSDAERLTEIEARRDATSTNPWTFGGRSVAGKFESVAMTDFADAILDFEAAVRHEERQQVEALIRQRMHAAEELYEMEAVSALGSLLRALEENIQ